MIPPYEKMLDEAYEKLNKLRSKKTSGEGLLQIPTPIVKYNKNLTIIENARKISDLSRRDMKILLKFLQQEFNVPCRIDGDTIVIQKNIDQSTVKKKIDMFIEYFVRCPMCKSLDTILKRENKIYIIKCLACGAESPVLYRIK